MLPSAGVGSGVSAGVGSGVSFCIFAASGVAATSLSDAPPLEVIAPEAVLRDDAASYHGVDGLRKAVVRFLGNAAKRREPVTLMLYSNQSMD